MLSTIAFKFPCGRGYIGSILSAWHSALQKEAVKNEQMNEWMSDLLLDPRQNQNDIGFILCCFYLNIVGFAFSFLVA